MNVRNILSSASTANAPCWGSKLAFLYVCSTKLVDVYTKYRTKFESELRAREQTVDDSINPSSLSQTCMHASTAFLVRAAYTPFNPDWRGQRNIRPNRVGFPSSGLVLFLSHVVWYKIKTYTVTRLLDCWTFVSFKWVVFSRYSVQISAQSIIPNIVIDLSCFPTFTIQKHLPI